MPIIDYTAQRALIHEAGQQTVDRPGELIVQALVAATAARASTHAIMASDAGGTRADIVAQLDRQAFDLIETHRVYTDISEMSMRTLVIAGMSDTERTSSTARCYRDMALSVMRQLPPIDSVNLDVRSEMAHRRMPVVFFAILIDAIWAARDLHNLAATDDDVADLLPPGIGNIVLRPLDPIRCRASFRFAPVESQVAWSALLAAVRALVRRCSSRVSPLLFVRADRSRTRPRSAQRSEHASPGDRMHPRRARLVGASRGVCVSRAYGLG